MIGELTGRTRWELQTGLFGRPRLVLLVEYSYPDGPDDSHGMPGYLAGTAWRPAQVCDLSRIQVQIRD